MTLVNLNIKAEFLYLQNDTKKPIVIKVNGKVPKPYLAPRGKQEIVVSNVRAVTVGYKNALSESEPLQLNDALRKGRNDNYVVHIVPEGDFGFKVGKIERYKYVEEPDDDFA